MQVKGEQVKKDFIRKSGSGNVFTAVQPCSVVLRAGEVSVVRGRSGSGKSTLLNMLSGILQPTAGRVCYDETDLYAMKDDELSAFRNRHIGYIPQGKSAVSSLTVAENILLPLMLFGQEDQKAAGELMERFSIAHLKDVLPRELSGGELRRMAIARALIRKPTVLFADEPTGDLDDENTAAVFEALKECAKEGAAVLVVTHEADAQTYADRVYRMDAGVLREDM